MSDLISRKALIAILTKYKFGAIKSESEREYTKETVLNFVKEQPTVEAVPVVHCRNCEHWGTGVAGETEHVKCCFVGKYMVGENGYCVYGSDMRKKERK